MHPKSPKLLADLLDAGRFVIQICASRSLESFRNDRLARQAAERNFEIMGEALRRLERLDPHTFRSIGEAHHVVRFRDFLAHSYDRIDHEVVWRIVQRDLPELLRRAAAVIGPAS